MSTGDDYIIITDSRNLNDDEVTKDTSADINNKEEGATAFELKKSGIVLLEQKEKTPIAIESHDRFYQELKDIGGIEILSNEEIGNENY